MMRCQFFVVINHFPLVGAAQILDEFAQVREGAITSRYLGDYHNSH